MRPIQRLSRQEGFSMMELLVALATMTIVTGCAFALIGGSLRFASATYHVTDAEETLRTGHEIINRDLTTAGDGLKGIGTITVASLYGWCTLALYFGILIRGVRKPAGQSLKWSHLTGTTT